MDNTPALEIISRTRALLHDEQMLWKQGGGYTDNSYGWDRLRWRADDLAIFVDEAQHEVCLRFPQANLVTLPIELLPGQYRQDLTNNYYSRKSASHSLVRIEAACDLSDYTWPASPGVQVTSQAAVFNSASYTLTPPKAWADYTNGAVLVVTVQQYTGTAPFANPTIPGLTTNATRSYAVSAGAIAAGNRKVTFKLFKLDAVPSSNTLSLGLSGTSTAYASRVFFIEHLDYADTVELNPNYALETWAEWKTGYNQLMYAGSYNTAGYPMPLSRAAQPRPGDYGIAIAFTKASTASVVTCDSYPMTGIHPYTDDLWTITTTPSALLAGFQMFGRATNPYVGEWELPPALDQTVSGLLSGGHFILRRAQPTVTYGSTIPMVQRDAIKSFYPESINDLYDSPTIPVEWYPETQAGMLTWFQAWSPDPNDPRGFYLYPPPTWLWPATRVMATVAAPPVPVRTPDDRLTLSLPYWPALTYWVAYRAMSIRTTTFNRKAARKYLALFEEAVRTLHDHTTFDDQRKGRANALPW